MCHKFGQDTSQNSKEVTGNILNENTGLDLPAIYTFMCSQKDIRADTGGTFDLLLSLNFGKNGGVHLWGHVSCNRSNTVCCIVMFKSFFYKVHCPGLNYYSVSTILKNNAMSTIKDIINPSVLTRMGPDSRYTVTRNTHFTRTIKVTQNWFTYQWLLLLVLLPRLFLV